MENAIVATQKKLNQKVQVMAEGGAGKLHVLADFDRTLTAAYVNGLPTPSLMSILRNGNYLSSNYAKKAHVLFDKYHLIEIDHGVALEEKKESDERMVDDPFSIID